MNIFFFLTPKKDVVYVKDVYSVEEVMEKMESFKYSAIPILDSDGRYLGTITEGDLLWNMKYKNYTSFEEYGKLNVMQIDRRVDNITANINSTVSEVLLQSMVQNFVPVVDDSNTFIGIVKRRDLIGYCYEKITYGSKENKPDKK